MNPNLRRRSGPQRPQAARRPQNGAGNARQQYERYLARARDAQLLGNDVEMENWYQHAEHYFRVMKGGGDERRD
jgi:Domain of unknown function (DUF4167)